jgi:putative tricarboxylic transport membrane protein
MTARLPGFVLLAIAGIYGWQALQIPVFAADSREAMTAQTMPLVLAGALSIIGVVLLFPKRSGVSLVSSLSADRRRWWQAFGLLGVCIVFGLVLEPLGVLFASALALLTSLLVLGVRHRPTLLLVPLLVSAGLWFLLVGLLGLYLDPGYLWTAHV